MRHLALAALTVGLAALAAPAQDDRMPPDPLALRFGMNVNYLSYPQKTPEDALRSVVRALEKRRVEYLVAQLADPGLVDARIAEYSEAASGGRAEARIFAALERLVRETEAHFLADPQLLRELRVLARDAEWQTNDDQAVATSKDVPERKVFMRRIGPRWFLENRQQ